MNYIYVPQFWIFHSKQLYTEFYNEFSLLMNCSYLQAYQLWVFYTMFSQMQQTAYKQFSNET